MTAAYCPVLVWWNPYKPGRRGCGKLVSRSARFGHPDSMVKGVGTWFRSRVSDESGDVPGWVLITLMTAGLVIIIWGLAGPALSNVFEQAIERVTGY
jgi:hypothetical protein